MFKVTPTVSRVSTPNNTRLIIIIIGTNQRPQKLMIFELIKGLKIIMQILFLFSSDLLVMATTMMTTLKPTMIMIMITFMFSQAERVRPSTVLASGVR